MTIGTTEADGDRDNRGPDTCLSPSPVPERKKRKGQGKVFVGKVGDRFQNIAIISVIPNMVKAGYRG